jgi:hypothetical protein
MIILYKNKQQQKIKNLVVYPQKKGVIGFILMRLTQYISIL